MDMASLLGTNIGTIPNYERKPYVHPESSLMFTLLIINNDNSNNDSNNNKKDIYI